MTSYDQLNPRVRGLITIAGAVALWAIAQLQIVVVPLVLAMLVTALLSPLVDRLARRLGRSLSAAMVIVLIVTPLVFVLIGVIRDVVVHFAELAKYTVGGIAKLQSWLPLGSLRLTTRQLDGLTAAIQSIGDSRGALGGAAFGSATAVAHILVGLLLVLFATFFFVRDGRRIVGSFLGLVAVEVREDVAKALRASWLAVEAYIRASVLTAFIEVSAIGLTLELLHVPLAGPIMAFAFLVSFIPIIGSTLYGTVMILVALAARPPLVAVVLALLIVLVHQLENHVLKPLVLGRALMLHPLMVVIAILAGAVLVGITGALVAVPILAMVNTALRKMLALRSERRTADLERARNVSDGTAVPAQPSHSGGAPLA